MSRTRQEGFPGQLDLANAAPTRHTTLKAEMTLSEAWRTLLLVLCLGWLPSGIALADDLLMPVTRFDSKGQLPQSNAAAQAVQRGGAVVAIVGRSEVLFVAPSPKRPPLVDVLGIPKMWKLASTLCLSHAGLSQDSRVLALLAQEAVLNHQDKYGEEMSVGEVVDVIAAKLQEATMMGNRRPYGTGMLVAGFLPRDVEWPIDVSKAKEGLCEGEDDAPSPVLYRVDPSGAYTMWRACAIGRDSSTLVSCLEEHYREGMAVADMLSLADTVLGKCSGFSGDRTPVDAALVSVKGTRLWERVAWQRLKGEILATATATPEQPQPQPALSSSKQEEE